MIILWKLSMYLFTLLQFLLLLLFVCRAYFVISSHVNYLFIYHHTDWYEGDTYIIWITITEIGEKRVRYVGDLTEDHFSSPKHAKKNFQFLMNTIKRQRDKINHLAISKRRLEKKVDSFESMMKHLY